MSALAQLNAIEKVQGSPADQQKLLQSIMQMHGSATGFYRAAAKEMGTTPDVVMEKVEAMAQQPQTAGLQGANAGTSVPQTMTPPPELNANSMDAQNRGLQQQGMGTAQAVNQSAQNPQNAFAKGGPVPPTPDDTASKVEEGLKNSAEVNRVLDVTKDTVAMQNLSHDPAKTQQMLDEYRRAERDKQFSKDPGKPEFGGYAKGGPVQDNIKNMPLKDVIKLLASHPGLAEGMPQDKGYSEGGEVHMDTGGSLQADSITSYGPDGTPIVQNADGTQGYGDINALLGRPKGAPTLGTGQDPQNATTKNSANSIGQQQPSGPAQNVTNNMLAKGGEEAGPPGALSHEVADDVPAKLSEGEFVFSGDSTRFWGLRLLNQMQDHAREQLSAMSNQGDIRHPGDGKNPDQEGFQQDTAPNMNAYKDQDQDNNQDEDQGDQMVSGILKECMGGANMAKGGGVSEEEFAKGGIITAASDSLTPKKLENEIPETKIKTNMVKSGGRVATVPKALMGSNTKNKQPKLSKGGLLKKLESNVNDQRNINQNESMIGA